MDPKTKQSIVGGAIIVIVAVIFLPMIFHHSNTAADSKTSASESVVKFDLNSESAGANNSSPEKVVVQQADISNPSQQTLMESSSSQDSAAQTAASPETPINSAPLVQSTENPQRSAQNFAQIAEEPKVEKAKVAELKSATQTTVENPVSPTQPAEPATKKPLVKQNDVHMMQQEEAWVLQLGQFNDISNANNLVHRLREQGYDAFIRAVENTHSAQVYIGPEVNLKRLKVLKARIKKQLQLTSVIKKYQV